MIHHLQVAQVSTMASRREAKRLERAERGLLRPIAMRARVSLCLAILGIATFGSSNVHAGDPLLDDEFVDSPEEEPMEPVVVVEGLRPDVSVVFTGEELRAKGYRTLGEALRDVVGVHRQHTSRHIRYGMRGVPDGLTLEVDGIPRLIDGERDLLLVDRDLDLDDIERVEIVRGPASALSGAMALSGLVRVKSKRPGLTSARVRLSGSALAVERAPVLEDTRLRAGPSTADGGHALAEREASGDATVRFGEVGLLVIAHGREGPTRAFAFERIPRTYIQVGNATLPGARQDVVVIPRDERSGSARAAVTFGGLLIDASASHVTESIPVSRLSHGLLVEDPDRLVRDRLRARALFDEDVGPVRLSLASFVERHDRQDLVHLYPAGGSFSTGGDARVRSLALSGGARGRLDLRLFDHHRVSAGAYADLTRLNARSDARAPGTGDVTEELVVFNDLTSTTSGALEYQGDLPFGVRLTAGAALTYRTGFTLAITPRASVAIAPSFFDGTPIVDGLSLRAAYAEGSRAPDRYDVTAISQLLLADLAVRAVDNPALIQEHARTAEIGARYAPSAALSLEGALFGTRHEAAVEHAVVDGYVVPSNLDARHVLGFELLASAAPARGRVKLDVGTWGGLNVLGPDLSADMVRGFAAIEARPIDALTVGTRARALFGLSPGVSYGPSSSIDAYGAFTFYDGGLRLLVAGQNLLDGRERSADLASLPGATDLAIPAPGRTVFLSLEGRL